MHKLAIKAAIKSGDKLRAYEIAQIQQSNIDKLALIDLYGHFGDIERGKRIFFDFELKNSLNITVICIGSMMNTLNKNGEYQQALILYDKYHELNNDVTHLLAVRAC